MTAALFENVGKVYKSGVFSRTQIPAVRDVSLTVPIGSVFGLLGPNRAGKTTLVKLLLSLSRPTAGQVSRFGEPIHNRRTLSRVGYMHENHAFPRYLSASEVLNFYGGLSSVSGEELAPRWSILLGKYLGVVFFVGFQATLFVGCTWLALGFATGVWSSAYWLAVPLLVLNFAVFYSVSVFLSVWTRSTVASAFGVLLFWLLCWLVDYSHLRMLAQPTGSLSPLSQFLMDAGYWILPKPLDLGSSSTR